MCGIAGIVGKGAIVREPFLKVLAQNLAHRGPDDEGIQILSVNQNCYLGLVHRRLSIIDLTSEAHQPMFDKGTGNWIVYNGEIYNYREIRKSLEEKGTAFNSNSDTEVILKAYATYGKQCLERLQGMFAFCIWDEREKILFLAVDRIGIKPLYFYNGHDGIFMFSSEIRPILNSGLIEKRIEPLAIDSFLAYGAVQAPLTMIEGIESLLPGHYLIFNTQKYETKIIQYWNLNFCGSNERTYFNEKDSIDRFNEVLKGSIKKHLVSDVPLGLFLSGGVDSSAIAILANKISKSNRLQSFSVVFPELKFSEARYSRLIGEKFCCNHNEIQLSETDLHSLLPQALDAMDQPTIDGINTYVISKVVRAKGIKAVLSGQGGDEVFGGYNTFRRIPFIKKVSYLTNWLPYSFRTKIAAIINSGFNKQVFDPKITQIIQSNGDILTIYLILRQLFSSTARRKIFREGTSLADFHQETKVRLSNEIKGLDLFSKISALEMRLYLSNMLLKDGDVMSMSHGLEIRVPFLDHELVKCVFSIPTHKKIHHKILKPLLINAVYKELPPQIYLRSKMGFTFPWEFWLRNKLRPQIEELLNEFPVNNEIGINIEKCREIWNLFYQYKAGITWSRVWAIYVLLNWYRHNVSTR